MALPRAERHRKVVHIAAGSFALLLRWMSGPEAAAMALAAFLFNWQVLPRLGGRTLWREAEHGRGYPAGILLYPLAVLGLVLAFPHDLWKAAAVWGVLAWGDGMATLAGQALGGPRLPWNRTKTWAGSTAFVVFGAAAAAALTVWTQRLTGGARALPWIVGGSLCLALVCAIAESLPLRLDDNVTISVAGALAMIALTHATEIPRGEDAPWTARVLGGLVLTAVIAALGWRARALDAAGALSTAIIGAAIVAGLGLRGLAVMVAFFLLGTAATRLGHARKAARGIAQEAGGARGWRNAWANGAVPAALAVGAPLAPPGVRELCVIAYAASVATAAADTCSSEIGKAYGRRTFSPTTLRSVPPGTEGGVSAEGTLGGLVAAALVATTGVLIGLHGAPAALLIALAGAAGSLAESVLGTLAGPGGRLGNHLLNGINTAIGAALAVVMALAAR